MSVKISSLNTASTINSGDTIGVAGNNPFYFSDWGGGWYMQDGTWMRSYASKSLWMNAGLIGGDGGLTIGYGGASPSSGGAIIAGSVGIGTSSAVASLDNQGGAGTYRQRSLTTMVTNTLSASGTQAKRFEIARVSIDYNDWNVLGTIEIELCERYYSRGLKKKYSVYYGYVSSSGANLIEMSGQGDNQFQVTLGAEVVIGGDIRYIPIYVDVRYYSQVNAIVKTTRNLTTSNPPAQSDIWLNNNPTGVDIIDFIPDSTVYVGNIIGGNSTFSTGNVLINTTTDAGYKLDVNGTARVSGKFTASSSGEVSQFISSTTTLYNTYRANSVDVGYIGNGTGVIGGGSATDFGIQTSNNFVIATGGATERFRIASTGVATFNSGTANQNTKIFGNKVGMSRTSDGAEVVYFSKNTDLGTEGTANIQGYDGIQFRTQGAETVKATITSGGNVLINTGTDSGHKLRVDGTTRFYSGASVTDAVTFTIGDGSNTLNYIPYVAAGDYNDLSYGGGSLLFNNISSRLTIGVHNGTAIRFESTNTLISGNVGIGTATPNEKLQVSGNISLGTGGSNQNLGIYHGNGVSDYGAIRFYRAGTNSNTIHSFSPNWQSGTIYNASAGAININGQTGTTFGSWDIVDVVFNTGGTNYFKSNVGIGTTSPSTLLTVEDQSNSRVASFKGAGGAAYSTFNIMTLGGNGNGYWRASAIGANIKMVSNQPAINVTGFSASSIVFGSDSNQGRIGFFTTSSNTGDAILSESMRIDTSGNVLIGTTTDAGYKLDVNGTARVSGAATFSSSVTTGGSYLINNTSVSKKGYKFQSPSSNWSPQESGIYFSPADGVNAATTFSVELWDGIGGYTNGLSIAPLGAATFVGRVTTPAWTTSGRNYSYEWIEFPSYSGLYSPNNGAHFYPNNGSYGGWQIQGARNGWAGLEFSALGNGQVCLMVDTGSNHTGFYNTSYGWQFYWTGGTLYVGKNTYGGGTNAAVLDSSNVGSYAVKTLATITGNIDSDYGECFVTFDPIPSGTPPLSSPNIRTINVGNSYSRRTQLAFDYASDKAYFRRRTEAGWFTWREFVHSGNVDSYALPISGGTLTGSLYGTSASFTGNVTAPTGYFGASLIRSTTQFEATVASGGFWNSSHDVRFYPSAGNIWNITGSTIGLTSFALRFLDSYNSGNAIKAQIFWTASNLGFFNDQNDWVIKANQGASYGGTLYGAWIATGSITASANSSISGAVNSAWGLQVENTGTTNANGLYVNIGASSTGVPFRVDKGGAALFDITNAGNATIKGNLTISGATISLNSSAADIFQKYNNGSKTVGWNLTTANLFRLYDYTNDLVILGFNATSQNLDIYSNTVTINRLTTSTATLIFNASTAGNIWQIEKSDANGLSFQKGGVQQFGINAAGQASFIGSLAVVGDYLSVGAYGLYSSTYTAYFRRNDVSSYGAWELVGAKGSYTGMFYNAPNLPHMMFNTTDGSGGLYYQTLSRWITYYHYTNNCLSIGGATSSASYRFYVNGDSRIVGTFNVSTLTTNGIVYSNGGNLTNTNPSDIRLKEDINPLQYGLKEVMALNPVTYKWKDGSNSGQRNTGLIAQDVQEIMPEYVKNISEDSEYLGLDSYAINIVLINAIKELKAEIEILKNK